MEGNFFRNANDPMMSSKQGTDARGSGTFSGEKGGVIKSWNNFYTGNKNWASEGGSTSASGRKLNFITNKYDYTNGTELGEYREWTETIGTQNTDGTWTIYDSEVTDTEDTIATNSLIAIEDAAKKGSYYQVSKSKTAFYIDVPANVQKVVVKAKCGSSGKSGTADMLSVNGTKVKMDLAADYTVYTVDVSVTSASTIEIANANSSNSMNIKEIKIIAATGWETTLSEGADLKNIDAYEVDSRSEQVPAAVIAKSGGTLYSNFDVALGDSGMGISIAPTAPLLAKTNVMAYAGRHASDYAFTFSNATDDESYALNETLNTELKAYKTSMTKIQGTAASSSGTGDTPSTGGDTPSTGGDNGNTGTEISASVECVFTGKVPSNSAFTVTGNYSDSKGTATVNGTAYSICVKMEKATSIKFTTSEAMKLTLAFASTESGKKVKIDGTDYTTDSSGVATVASLSAGSHEITKGDSINLFYIGLSK